jgi:hypothetical protein
MLSLLLLGASALFLTDGAEQIVSRGLVISSILFLYFSSRNKNDVRYIEIKKSLLWNIIIKTSFIIMIIGGIVLAYIVFIAPQNIQYRKITLICSTIAVGYGVLLGELLSVGGVDEHQA